MSPVAWQGTSAIGIEECFVTGTGKRGPEPQERKDAESLLREMLAAGPLAVAEVVAAAKELGLSDRTVRRAKSVVGVGAFKQTYEGPWMWKLLPSPQVGQVTPLSSKPGQMDEMDRNPYIHGDLID